MRTITATEAQNQFGKLLQDAENGPVLIQRNGREQAVLVSAAEFRRLTQGDQASPLVKELLRKTMDEHRSTYAALAK